MKFLNERYGYILDAARGKTVLDLGCCGYSVADCRKRPTKMLDDLLYQQATKLVGVDIVPDQVALLQAEGRDVRCGDVCSIQLSMLFDLIVAGNIIEHVSDVGKFLANCAKHMKADGNLIITTGNPYSMYNFLSVLLLGRVGVSEDHTCWLCPSTMAMQARVAGLEIAEVCVYDHSRFRWAWVPGILRRYWAADWLFRLRKKVL